MINYFISAVPHVFDFTEIVKYGPAFSVMVAFLVYVLSQNKDLKADNKILSGNHETLLRETITVLNKSSFVLENAPIAIRQHARDSIREEMASIKEEINILIRKQ